MLFPIIVVYFLFMKPVPKLQKMYSSEKHNKSNIISVHEFKNKFECYEVNISKMFLPFVFNYNKKYSIFYNFLRKSLTKNSV